MFFVLGLVAAGLAALLTTPPIARRAARRARRELEAALPTSRSEVAAEKDQLRARHAITSRRLEQAVGRLNENLAARMVEASRQREEIAALSRRERELSASLAATERRVAELSTSLERTEHRLSAASAELVLREERLNARGAEVGHLKSNIAIRDLLTEEQRLELVARETALDNLKDALQVAEATGAAIAAARNELAAEFGDAETRIAERDQRIQALDASRAVLESERAERITELERRAAELAGLRAEIAALEVRQLEVAAIDAERASLRAENAELRRAAGIDWEDQRRDNQDLREQLGEIAADVVRMVDVIAGHPASIASDGNGHGAPPHNGNGHMRAVAPPADQATGTVEPIPTRADNAHPAPLGARLRALQRTGTRH